MHVSLQDRPAHCKCLNAPLNATWLLQVHSLHTAVNRPRKATPKDDKDSDDEDGEGGGNDCGDVMVEGCGDG